MVPIPRRLSSSLPITGPHLGCLLLLASNATTENIVLPVINRCDTFAFGAYLSPRQIQVIDAVVAAG